MRTNFKTKEENAEALIQISESIEIKSVKRPDKFIQVMQENRGNVATFDPKGPAADGMEKKNPLIVVLGDSVTAGHFEFACNPEDYFKSLAINGRPCEDLILEVTDSRESYPEKFREQLIDYFEQTSVSCINSGIAGDTLIGMQRRLYRDVIRYQPELVIVNASLNWPEQCGDTENYKRILLEVVSTIKNETKADIILLTPNMEISGPYQNPKSSLEERVEVIRSVAESEDVCLCDVYSIWKEYEKEGNQIADLLANGMNHPSTVGHLVYAKALMRLIK